MSERANASADAYATRAMLSLIMSLTCLPITRLLIEPSVRQPSQFSSSKSNRWINRNRVERRINCNKIRLVYISLHVFPFLHFFYFSFHRSHNLCMWLRSQLEDEEKRRKRKTSSNGRNTFDSGLWIIDMTSKGKGNIIKNRKWMELKKERHFENNKKIYRLNTASNA